MCHYIAVAVGGLRWKGDRNDEWRTRGCVAEPWH